MLRRDYRGDGMDVFMKSQSSLEYGADLRRWSLMLTVNVPQLRLSSCGRSSASVF
jgi:hypothetical protein